MKQLFIMVGLLMGLVFSGCEQPKETLSIIPVPLKAEIQGGAFVVNEQTRLWVEAPEADKQILQEFLAASPLKLAVASEAPEANAVVLKQVAELPGVQSPEGYVLTTTSKGVEVQAKTGAGLFYGVQTLLQMAREANKVAFGTITDEPRFEYRGMMLDVSRHFFGLDFVKKQIDAMAYYKLNRLHIHLTDAAGWRIEIKKYPRLTNFAAWRTHDNWKDWWNGERKYVNEGDENAHGGYFTQDQCREIVEYAQKHYITVIPEIEMPSHSEEVTTAYMCHKTGKGHNDFSAPEKLYLEPSKGAVWLRPVVVLTNRGVYSSANHFVMMMRELPNVIVMGDKTGGGSGMPLNSTLPNGWNVRFSACPILDAQGKHTEFGIEPDVKVHITESDWNSGRDTMIERAKDLIKEFYAEQKSTEYR